MITKFRYLLTPLAIVAGLATAIISAGTALIDRALGWLGELFTYDPLDGLDFDYGAPDDIGGNWLEPSLLESLRHEAGVRRQAAARHC